MLGGCKDCVPSWPLACVPSACRLGNQLWMLSSSVQLCMGVKTLGAHDSAHPGPQVAAAGCWGHGPTSHFSAAFRTLLLLAQKQSCPVCGGVGFRRDASCRHPTSHYSPLHLDTGRLVAEES